jgi:hypothetical protein
MTQPYKRKEATPKYNDVKRLIEQYRLGRGTFTPGQLARDLNKLNAAWSPNVTQSLRTALAQAEVDKLVERFRFLTGERGSALGYLVINEQPESEFPF